MEFHGTTVLCLRKGKHVIIMSDGQLTMGHIKVKDSLKKVRKLADDKVLAAFAGSCEGLPVLDALERKLQQYPGQLMRAIIELVRQWHEIRLPVKAEIQLIAADAENIFLISSNAEVMVVDDTVAAIGSGGFYALSAAKALLSLELPDLSATDIARRAMTIASELCIYTNNHFTSEILTIEE